MNRSCQTHIAGLFFIIALVIPISFTLGCQTLVQEEPKGEDEILDNLSEDARIKNDIEILIEAMSLPKPKVEAICTRLINYGATAVPHLAENIENRIPTIRLLSIYCLGRIYEKTKSESVLELKPKFIARLSDSVIRVKLEAAATLCSLGDHSGVYLLIDALRSKEKYVRMVASQALADTFQLTFGYQYYEENDAIREQSVRRWEEWWLQNKKK